MSCERKQYHFGIMDPDDEFDNSTIPEDDLEVFDHPTKFDFLVDVETIKLGVNGINQFIIILITSLISWRCVSLKLKKTAMHGFLCSLSSMFFLTEGIMTGYRGNIFLWKVFTSIQIILHITFNFIAMVLTGAGVICKYKQKKAHFHTHHGKFGVAALLLLSLNMLCGLCFFFISSTKVMAFMHAGLSVATYVTVMIAQMSGYDSGFFQRNFHYIPCFKVMTFTVIFLSFDSLFEFLIDLVMINFSGSKDSYFRSINIL